ncbi:hypothetical protein JIG36_49790 [Actinoplanes sp. LDG1-06]|uniref:NACHT domain-containing protein n=1 Tax=Paractinoplanes ovalisporus TaxID=2810368 RepID=A0ABS2AUQ4_9ACTN|nr:hypothetical protein [Actinoplanes ovalisporus]MBM2623608.1 hypothetical protein [Actinoplanes ovalisporus]
MKSATFAAAVALAGLAAVIAFLITEGRANADQWSSSLSFVLAYVGMAGTVVGWVATRRESVAGGAEIAEILRTAVRLQWADEAQVRDLQSPRPLRLRWRPTRRPVATASRSSRKRWALSGELLQDDGDIRPAAVALAEAFTASCARQLVVLGRPGAGKTTLAMLYVLAATASPDAGEPVPVLLSVAGWDPDIDVEDWVEGRIVEDYPVFGADRYRRTLRSLIRDGGVIAVLDGLDEMPAESLPEALRRLDRATDRGMRSLVTCRATEFEAAVGESGLLAHADIVEIEPITVEDAAYFLTQREPARSQRWASVLTELRDHPDGAVAASLDTPLTVSLARQVFRSPGSRPEELTGLGSPAEIQRRLLDRFLPSVYPGERGAARATRHLSFLSHHLREVVGDPNLRWWELSRAVPPAVITTGVILIAAAAGLLVAVALVVVGWQSDYSSFWSLDHRVSYASVGAVAVGCVLGAFSGFHAGRILRPGRPPGLIRAVANDLATIFALVSLVGAVLAIVLLARYCTSRPAAYALSFRIQDLADRWLGIPDSMRQLGWIVLVLLGGVALTNGLTFGLGGTPRRASLQARTVVPSLVFGMSVGSVFGLIATVVYSFAAHQPPTAWPGVVTAAGFGIPLALGKWLNAPGETRRAPSPDSVLVADRAALVVSAVVVAGSVQFVALPLLVVWGSVDYTSAWAITSCCAVVVFVIVFLGSGSSWVSYLVARLWLALRGRIPWRLSRFLRNARDLGVLRQAGPAYQVRHDLILNHLADQWPGRTRSFRRPSSPGRARRRRRLVIIAGSLVMAALLPAAVFAVESRARLVPIAVYDAGRLGRGETRLAVGSSGTVTAAFFDPQDDHAPWSVIHWEAKDRRGTVRSGNSPEAITDVAVDEAGNFAVAQIAEFTIYDAQGRRSARRTDSLVSGIGLLGNRFIISDQQGVQSWPVRDAGRPVPLPRIVSSYDRIAGSADGHVVATSGDAVRVWDLRTGSVRVLPGLSYGSAIALSADGSTLMAQNYTDNGVNVWRLTGGEYRRVLHLPGGSNDRAISPDGNLIAVQTYPGSLELFDTMSGRRVATMPRSGCVVTAVAFDQAGSRLATGCGDKIKLWSLTDMIAEQA